MQCHQAIFATWLEGSMVIQMRTVIYDINTVIEIGMFEVQSSRIYIHDDVCA
jgi:hypothetical protein